MELTNAEKDELNKIGNTIDIMGEEVEKESMFGNKKVTELRRNLIKKGYLKVRPVHISDNTIKVTLSPKGWDWYYARGK